LNTLGFETVQDVRQGKYIEVTIDEEDTDIAKQKLNQMCEKLLANLVIEDYSVEIE
jgi:phosphoribosylformylglycinamidine synthase